MTDDKADTCYVDLFFLSVNIYKRKSEMYATTKRGHI